MRLFASALFALLLTNICQAAVFAGYDQFCGLPVIMERTSQIAVASRDSAGKPIIYIDPGALNNWTHSRIFTLAHECGHHRLGHVTPSGFWFRENTRWATKVQELQADCWASIALRKIWKLDDINRVIAMYRNEGNISPGGYPSGLVRAENIKNCAYGSYPGESESTSAPSTSTESEPPGKTHTPYSYRRPEWMTDSNSPADKEEPRRTSQQSRFGRYLEIVKEEIPRIFEINGTSRKYSENGVCRMTFEFAHGDKSTFRADLDLREDIVFIAGEINNRWIWVEVDKWMWIPGAPAPGGKGINPNSKLSELKEDGSVDDRVSSFGMVQYVKQEHADKARDMMTELLNICHGNSI